MELSWQGLGRGALDRLRDNELAAVRWLLGQVLVLISLAGSYSLDLGADLLTTIGIGLIFFSCLIPQWVERIPRLIWKIAPAILLVLVVTDFVLSGGDVLPPLFRMVLILTLFRGLQIRSPREDLQLLLLSLFLLIITGVLSQELLFGVQLLFYAPFAMGQLFVVNLSVREPGVPLTQSEERVFRGFNWVELIRHIIKRLDYGTLISGIILFLCMTTMALLLFILMPRFDIGAALPFPRLQTNSSLTGFSDHVEYGDVVSILEDDSIAMRVDVVADSPVARPYWRMVVLDAYYDGGFMVSPRVARDHRKGRNYIFHFQHEQGTVLDDSIWTLYIEGGISSYLPTGDVFRSFRFKNRTDIQMHDLTRVYQTTEINASTLSIRYNGLRFDGVIPFGEEDHKLMGQNPVYQNTENASYLKDVSFPGTLLVLPEGNPNRRVLSDAMRRIGFQKSMSVEEFSDRAVLYLQRGRGYSLESEIPEGDADRLLRWVASGQAGHCELYAGAFVLLARSAGIPARMVTGFVGGDWNGFENYFMVRNRNAHAWCEVLDPKRGWIRVDPTPGYALDAGSVDEALAGGNLEFDRSFKAYLDSLSILWFRRVIQFDSTDQQEMAEIMKGAGLKGFDWIKDRFQRMKEQFKNDWESVSLRGEWTGMVRGSLVPLFTVGLIFVIPIFLWRRGHRRGFEEIMRRKAGRLLRDRKMRGLRDEGSITDALNLIRYGPVSSWPERPAQFLAAKIRLKEPG